MGAGVRNPGFFPPTTEGLVQRHKIHRNGALAVGKLVFRLVQRALRVEYVNKITEPLV